MKINILILFIVATKIIAQPIVTDTAITQVNNLKLGKPINLIFYRSNDGLSLFSFETAIKKYTGSFDSPFDIEVIIADLNYDSYADIWATACPDGQCRARKSDVWLWNTKKTEFTFDSTLSSFNNLEIDTTTKIFEAGIWNCGCAGKCYFRDTYAWREGKLIKIARREQDCLVNGDILYREYELLKDTLTIQFESKDEQVITQRKNQYKKRYKFLIN